MRLISACPTLKTGIALAGLLATTLSAAAGDLSNGGAGGIKDYGNGGIPVPAPMPYEETYKWYLRGDIGTGVKHQGTFGVDGFPVSVNQPREWHELSIVSFGFGRYITPSFRTEFTVDYRVDRTLATGNKALADITKSARIADTATGGGIPITNIQRNIYAGMQNEDMTYGNSTFLASAFYDLNREGRLKPYVGAGIGLARHQLTRNGTVTYECYDGFVSSTPQGGATATVQTACATVAGTGTPATGGLDQKYVSVTRATAIGWGLAAQLSAGLTYDLTPRTHWDTGYRMLWQSGRVAVTSGDGLSAVRVQDRFDHEVRTGIRWDLW